MSGQAKDLFGSTSIYKPWSISHNLIQTTLRWCYWYSSVCALTHAHIRSAPIWLQVRASTYSLNQSGTEQESFGFTFTILPGRRLLDFPSFFSSRKGTLALSYAWKWWERLALAIGGHIFQEKKKKVHHNINFRSDRGRFFPGIGSCKHLTARCERLLGSWMKPKEFDAFYSAPRTASIYLRAFKPFSSTQTQSPLHH